VSDGNNFGYVLFSGTGGWVLQDSMTVVSTMTLSGGTLDSANNDITVGGSWWNTGTNFIPNTATVLFTGGNTQKLRSNGRNFSTVRLHGTGGNWVMQDSMTLTGDLFIDDGRLDATASNFPIFLQGSWANTGGNFVANASTVTFAAPALAGETIE